MRPDVGNGGSDPVRLQRQREKLTPDSGFCLVGIDRLADVRGELYEIERYDRYQDALDAKNSRDSPEEYYILYRDAEGNCCHR